MRTGRRDWSGEDAGGEAGEENGEDVELHLFSGDSTKGFLSLGLCNGGEGSCYAAEGPERGTYAEASGYYTLAILSLAVFVDESLPARRHDACVLLFVPF